MVWARIAGAGEVRPFYDDPPAGAQRAEIANMCEPCDGYGRVPEEGSWAAAAAQKPACPTAPGLVGSSPREQKSDAKV